MTKTIRERLAAALEARGCRVVEKTKKRWKLERPTGGGAPPRDAGPTTFYFLGASGSLRAGRIASDTISLTGGPLYRELLK